MVFLLAAFLATGVVCAGSSESEDSASAQQKQESKLGRWIDIQNVYLGIRFRHIDYERNGDIVNVDQGQHKEQFKGRFLFDSKGKFSLNGNVSSGGGFTSSWNNFGWGTGDFNSNLYLRHLFLSAQMVKGVEAQYGGFHVERGVNTEITSFDNDNYMMGERLLLSRPDKLFFDQVIVTYGHLGDVITPDIRKRFNRLQKSNYHQFLVAKKVGKRLTFSADYTFLNGSDTMREAVAFNLPANKILDSVVFENYQRLDGEAMYGFAAHVRKALHKLVRVSGGYADIDTFYGLLNGDRFSRGSRFFGGAEITVLPNLTAEAFVQRAVNIDDPISNRTRVDLILSYNLAPGLKKTGLF